MDTNISDDVKAKFLKKRGSYSSGALRLLLIALIPVIFLWLVDAPPAAAQSAGDFFRIDYASANLSQSEVNGDVVFYAAISVKVTCIKDPPMSVSEAGIISSVVAKNTLNGATVTLNPGYTLTIKPFPSKAGEVGEIRQSVPLQFPGNSESGDYTITAKLIEAKVKVAFIWAPVTDYLPQSQTIGSVKYISPGISQALSPPQVMPSPTPSTAAPALAPAPALPSVTAAAPSPPKTGFARWMWLVLAIAVATAVVNITMMLRRRAARRANR